jgi:hypothetical protein
LRTISDMEIKIYCCPFGTNDFKDDLLNAGSPFTTD